MKLWICAALVAFLPCVSVHAQTYIADDAPSHSSADGDYGQLLRRVTQGLAVRPMEPGVSMEGDQRTTNKPAVAKLKPSQEERTGAIYLHRKRDFALEPHPVSIVDRSRFAKQFRPIELPNDLGLQPGSILVSTQDRLLYVGLPNGKMRRFGVAVGKDGALWSGTAIVGRKAKWPDWRPTENIRKENPSVKSKVEGGATNPLGARAIYLHSDGKDTMYRIHGTNQPFSIGRFASHGCIRMINEDVIELYKLVREGATVTVI